MCDRDAGVLYTEYSQLADDTPMTSVWSCHTSARDTNRAAVTHCRGGNREYWLERNDPLLNSVLPGTHASVTINAGDAWALGRSSVTSELLPSAVVFGPMLRSRILHVGGSVRAVGVAIPIGCVPELLGLPAEQVLDKALPLEMAWPRLTVRRLLDAAVHADLEVAARVLRDAATERIGSRLQTTGAMTACALIQRGAGRVSVAQLADEANLSRQQFTRRFRETTGLTPKAFARLARFEKLVSGLLITDVARWSSLAVTTGFFDQAHMINEFRSFAGVAPTSFFRPAGTGAHSLRVRLRGRPSDWISQLSATANIADAKLRQVSAVGP